MPAIAYWPGVIQPGVTNALAQNVDLFPTVRELAGLGEARGSARVLDGVSMVPLLRGGAGLREGVVYYPQFTRRDRGLYAARFGKYKAHFATQGSMQCGPNNTDASCRPAAAYTVLGRPAVYDLELDPSEEYPLEFGTPE